MSETYTYPKLNPCPFCGGKGHVHDVRDFGGNVSYANIYCGKCGATSGTFTTVQAAADNWNGAARHPKGDLVLKYSLGSQDIIQSFGTIMDFTDKYPQCLSQSASPSTTVTECLIFQNHLNVIHDETMENLYRHLVKIMQ